MSNTKLTPAQQEVLDALRTIGPNPDVVLVPVVQHIGRMHQSSSGIRTRRSELALQGRIRTTGQVRIKGRNHLIWETI